MGIVRPTMVYYPHAWAFFIPFIIVTSFAVLNLFIGIIVDAMQMVQKNTRQIDRQEIKSFTHEELQNLHQRFDELKQQIQQIRENNRG